jgi:hypothetical protein
MDGDTRFERGRSLVLVQAAERQEALEDDLRENERRYDIGAVERRLLKEAGRRAAIQLLDLLNETPLMTVDERVKVLRLVMERAWGAPATAVSERRVEVAERKASGDTGSPVSERLRLVAQSILPPELGAKKSAAASRKAAGE